MARICSRGSGAGHVWRKGGLFILCANESSNRYDEARGNPVTRNTPHALVSLASTEFPHPLQPAEFADMGDLGYGAHSALQARCPLVQIAFTDVTVKPLAGTHLELLVFGVHQYPVFCPLRR